MKYKILLRLQPESILLPMPWEVGKYFCFQELYLNFINAGTAAGFICFLLVFSLDSGTLNKIRIASALRAC
jgi:hypothetical protein